jgi:tetratricopeptide (TPR) repeat protein
MRLARAFQSLPIAAVLAASPSFADNHWIRIATPHFEMFTTADEKKGREAILHFERVRDFFLQASGVKVAGEVPVRIVAFRDDDGFHQYAPNQRISAYFAPGPARDSIVMEDPSPENYPIATHEYMHLVVRHSGLRIPLWLNEGWAEVFATLRPAKDGVAVGDLISRHMGWIAKGEWIDLKELDGVDRGSPDYNESARSGLFYAESWALAHMLYLSPEYKDRFPAFINALNKGQPVQDALVTAFDRSEKQVFEDLKNYLFRKKLYGTVFLAPFPQPGEAPVVTRVAAYDESVMLADLHAASGQTAEASQAYRRLERENPKRPEAFESAGYLAVLLHDRQTARTEFEKAFGLGSEDARMCLQLAALDQEAGQPPAVIASELEKALKLRPDLTEAAFELGIVRLAARDFDAVIDLLGRVPSVAPAQAAIFYSALAYANLQKGNLDAARGNAESFRKAASSPGETQRADRLTKLIEARAQGPAAAQAGEKLLSEMGTALGLRCDAPESGAMSKMGITIGGKQVLFDMPEPAAVEIAKRPGTTAELKCGPLPPFPLVVEYTPRAAAPAPPGGNATILNQPSAGIIRRLEF